MAAAPAAIRIVPAREDSLSEINDLIARSKSHWDWPDGYLEQALSLHRLAPAYLRGNHCCAIMTELEKLIGFLSIVVNDGKAVLDNLWITPERIGHGIGRYACEYAFRWAAEQEWKELWVVPDPPAEGFYRRMGFVDTGERIASRVPAGPTFSVHRRRL
jgi:GNAT superfamily N-acetyltransferase